MDGVLGKYRISLRTEIMMKQIRAVDDPINGLILEDDHPQGQGGERRSGQSQRPIINFIPRSQNYIAFLILTP